MSEITGYYVGKVVTVTQYGEHFGKQGVIKEVYDEDCLVRVPVDEDCFNALFFDKENLK